MHDHIIRALSTRGGIRILACSVSSLARQICTLQRTSATASIALGRGLAAGALMGGLLKERQRIALKFEGNGPLQKMIIEADHDGAVRATVGNPLAEAEPVNGRWNVAGIIGKAGFLTVSKDIGMGGEPYRGTVQLCTSEIGDDLAYYLTDSEQIPSAVGLAATIDSDSVLSVCGGFLVQALPGADESEIDAIMTIISSLPSLSNILQEEGTQALVSRLFGDTSYTLLETQQLEFRCSCSHEKVIRALSTFVPADLHTMIHEDQGATVTCEFCQQHYTIAAEELHLLATSDSSNSLIA